MARAYSQDLRDRVLRAVAAGLSTRQAAARYQVGIATAIVWVRRARSTGETAARRQGPPRGSKLDAHAAFLLGLVAATPHLTLAELQVLLREERGASAGIGTLWRFFAVRGITYKKNRACGRAGPRGRRRGPGGVVRGAARP